MKQFILNLWYSILYQFNQHKNEIPAWWYQQKEFDLQPDWVKRVTIAQDVIAQINTKRYLPKHGRYVSSDSLQENKLTFGSIKENFDKINNCQVCGIGACFLSIVKYKNNVNFEEIESSFLQFVRNDKFREILLNVFPLVQLKLIEHAFECGINTTYNRYSDVVEPDWNLKEQARCFGIRYADESDRLVAIMKNIIINRGDFNPYL